MDGKGHIEGWTADEVADFLASLDLDQYSEDFIENGITGDILIHLDHDALRDIGVESVGHRLNILRTVYEIKIADEVPIEPDHYIPATVNFESTTQATTSEISKDLVAITEAIQVRDERLLAAEAEIKRLTEVLTRLKDQLTPVFKIVKELQPLPTPEGSNGAAIPLAPPSASLGRKFSTKKLFLGSAPKQTSPTHVPSNYIYSNEPESPRSPNKHVDLPIPMSRAQTPISHPLPPLMESPGNAPVPPRPGPPPRPPPPGVAPLNTKREVRELPQETSTPGNNSTLDAFKSFRVGLDDSCSKVLPVALKKYRINSDWREYSLFICYADQERCLGMDEKPLLIFQELQRANKSPVFMLRKIESGSSTNILPVRGAEQEMKF